MGTVLNSLDNMLASAQANGLFTRLIYDQINTNPETTLPTTANPAGYIGVARFPNPFTMPSIGGGLSGVYFPTVEMNTGMQGIVVAAIETVLGTLTVSGNSFAAGSTMPTKPDPGNPSSNIQTGTGLAVAVFTAAGTLSAGTTLTTTYTNQAGTASQATGAVPLPANPIVNSGYLLNPHLANGDTGMQSVSNCSISAGSAGTIKIMGLLPIGYSIIQSAPTHSALDQWLGSSLLWKVQAADTIAFYFFTSIAGKLELYAHMAGVADN